MLVSNVGLVWPEGRCPSFAFEWCTSMSMHALWWLQPAKALPVDHDSMQHGQKRVSSYQCSVRSTIAGAADSACLAMYPEPETGVRIPSNLS